MPITRYENRIMALVGDIATSDGLPAHRCHTRPFQGRVYRFLRMLDTPITRYENRIMALMGDVYFGMLLPVFIKWDIPH